MGKEPDGDLAPLDGALPRTTNSLSLYLHIPFCARRCGYCDFNTYTADELTRDGVTVNHNSYIDAVIRELDLARKVLGQGDIDIPTIFIGGGTPSLLAPELISATLKAVKERFEISDRCEVTMEANPDSVTSHSLEMWRSAGVNRLSMGMQSAVPHVLKVLDRTHDPDNVEIAVQSAKAVGFDRMSVDLIYGAPGESISDWQRSLDQAIALNTDHVSAYALIVEEGTRLAAQVKRGEVLIPDDDETAEKYLMADAAFESAGLAWYELSNWSRPGSECQHNRAYWESQDWWGIGPGAHSHVQGVRWWNVKHPAAYASRLEHGHSPAAAREALNAKDQSLESILLQLRLRSGLNTALLDDVGRAELHNWIARGDLIVEGERAILTKSGRLVADAIARAITP